MLQKVKENIHTVFVGKEQVVDLVLTALLANGHILLEDVPGTGKTLLAKTLAKSVSGTFNRVQFTPDVLPSDVTGIEYFNPKTSEFETRIGPVYTNILLADEINRAMPRTQSSLLEAMEERQVTIEKQPLPLPNPFLVIATQNPIESQGTFTLPDAQLDRFLMLLPIGYPSAQEELEIMRRFRHAQPLTALQPVMALTDIVALQEQVKEVHIAEAVEQYILQLVGQTRTHTHIAVGVSPRGTLALMRAAQAYAFLQNRHYVIPEDIKKLVPFVWTHRLILSMDGALRTTKEEIIHSLLQTVDVPVEITK